MRETPISREAKTTVKKRPPKETFVQFRISLDEFASLSPITKQAVNEGKIKAPTISTLARASLITMANWKSRIDQANAKSKKTSTASNRWPKQNSIRKFTKPSSD
jgi:uncharacterized membrane protein